MKRSILLTHLIVFLTGALYGQTSKKDSLMENISFYADVMVNANLEEHRIKAHDLFRHSLNKLIEYPESFSVSLDSIPWISVLHGNGFRLITWQLRISNEEYKYAGLIQWSDKIIELKDTRPWVNGSLRNTYSPASWYGALYYKMIPFKSAGKDYYILFGFNAENSLLNTKVVDVLDLSGNEVTFGAPVFHGKEDAQTRIILTYADASAVQLFYDPDHNAIVHDHLMTLPGVGPSGEPLAVSDGSQEGWILKNGKWVYESMMYDVKSETPPMGDDRKDRKEDKDLLGRPKKN